jgi:hypothetical protein
MVRAGMEGVPSNMFEDMKKNMSSNTAYVYKSFSKQIRHKTPFQ